LVVKFNQLELIKDINGKYDPYYIKIYENILLLWEYVNENIPNIENHNHYPYLYLFMKNIDKLKNANKGMNRVTRTVLKSMGKNGSTKPENGTQIH
jgi:hypothetical protein